MVHRQSSSGPVDPSFRVLSGRLKFMVRRHKFNKDSSQAPDASANMEKGSSSSLTSVSFHFQEFLPPGGREDERILIVTPPILRLKKQLVPGTNYKTKITQN